jgi:hypothetical protein
MKKPVIIVGYPKSGNTWVTRLVGELLDCPVAGFWGEPENPEIAIEGSERESRFACFKAHHQHAELYSSREVESAIVIYVVRDPRDVAISASHYFFNGIEQLMSRFESSIYNHEKFALNKMINTVLYGDESISEWFKCSWKEHLFSYINTNTLLVRYENLVDNSFSECTKILDYICLNRSDTYIENAI